MSQDGHVDGQHVVEQPREQQQGPHAPHVASVGSEGSRDSGKAVRFASSLANSLHGAAPAGGSSYGTSPPGMSERLGGSSASFDEAASVISSSVTYGARGMGTGPAAQPPPSGVGQHTDAEQQALAASSAASLAQALHQGTDPTLPVRVPVGRHGSLAAAAGMHQHEQQQQQQQQAGASTAAGAQLPAAASAMHAGQQQDEDDSVRPVCAFYKRTGERGQS